MRRRRLLSDVAAGTVTRSDVCDPHPSLLRLARRNAPPLDEDCPLCTEGRLAVVGYAFGPRMGAAGRSVTSDNEIERLAARRGRFTIYEVEICPSCGWNHLMRSYAVGDDIRPATTPFPQSHLPINLTY